MKVSELRAHRRAFLDKYYPYKREYFSRFNYSLLNNVMYLGRPGRGPKSTYNDCIIMIDTETSKEHENKRDKKGKLIPVRNFVCAWTITINCFDRNLVTLYGENPVNLSLCIDRILEYLQGDRTIMYVHNLSYDWVFIRRFLFTRFGYPVKQLNTKSHYPIRIEFENGLILKDSLILSQRSLDKWAKDLNVEHQKAVGFWDYNKIRDQKGKFTEDELTYIEHDTLAGVECIQATMKALGKKIHTMPYTATGIPREEVRKRGKSERAHDRFLRQALDFDQYMEMLNVFHGGYTHANRWYIGDTIKGEIDCYDFASSYPFCMLAHKFPMEKFTPAKDCKPEKILNKMDTYAFYFKFIAYKIQLKEYEYPMPALQSSKAVKSLNAIYDNGRILQADYIEIWLTEQDLDIICRQYEYADAICCHVQFAYKDYLPKWFRDYIFECFTQKTMLKGGDPVLYAIYKAKVNCLYGMCVQRSINDDIIEDYETGEYFNADMELSLEDLDEKQRKDYERYIKSHNSVLPYQWGVWVTAYAMYNLFDLGACFDTWYYSDTDSVYGSGIDQDKLDAYNQRCRDLLTAAGYGPVHHNGRDYWLGVAELDGHYTEFRTLGAKRYAKRDDKGVLRIPAAVIPENSDRCKKLYTKRYDKRKLRGTLHITVAGVPKKGAACLKNDINNFKAGFVFPGTQTGKLTHTYLYDDIQIKDSIMYGDSVDLTPCDYLLDAVNTVDWERFEYEEIDIQIYEEE